jgi:hypothetical protein
MSALQSSENELRLAHRDVRVTANGLQLARRTAPWGSASQFARAIMDRYGGQPVRWPRLGLVFRQDQPGVTVQAVYHQTQMRLAPRLALRVLTWPRPHPTDAQPTSAPAPGHPASVLRLKRRLDTGSAAPVSASTPVWPTPKLKRAVETILVMSAVGRPGRAPRPELRLASRAVWPPDTGPLQEHRRLEVDAVEQLVRRLVTRRMQMPPLRPVPRVVHRAASIVVSPETATSAPEAQRAASRNPFPMAGNRSQTSDFPPIDLNRLTDQVVQAIDRRIIAHRERMGRI